MFAIDCTKVATEVEFMTLLGLVLALLLLEPVMLQMVQPLHTSA